MALYFKVQNQVAISKWLFPRYSESERGGD